MRHKYGRNWTMRKFFVCILLVSLFLSALTPAHAAKKVATKKKTTNKAVTASSQEKSMSPADIFKKKADSVVTIYTLNQDDSFGNGSGFFVEKSDLILTNFHVISRVDDVNNIVVLLKNKTVLPVVGIVAQNPDADLALLRVAQTNSTPLTIAKGLPNVGESIVVIGAPRGYSHTLTDGMLSAIDRGQNGEYIQISAPISPGSSGSPVFNDKGEVVGIVTFTDARNFNQNLNFAPSAATIKDFLNEKPFLSFRDYKIQQRQKSNKLYYKAKKGDVIHASGDYEFRKSIKLLQPIKSTIPAGPLGIHFWFEITAPCILEYAYTYKGLDLYAASANLVKTRGVMGLPQLLDGDLLGIFINPQNNGYGWFATSSTMQAVWTRNFKQKEFSYIEDTKTIYFNNRGTVCIVTFKGINGNDLIFNVMEIVRGNVTNNTGDIAININRLPDEFVVGDGILDIGGFDFRDEVVSYEWTKYPSQN